MKLDDCHGGAAPRDVFGTARLLCWISRETARWLGPHFHAPGWDMLLDLFLAHSSADTMCVTTLSTGNRLALATGVRWAMKLEAAGLVESLTDHNDARRRDIAITAHGRHLVEKTLEQALAASDTGHAHAQPPDQVRLLAEVLVARSCTFGQLEFKDANLTIVIALYRARIAARGVCIGELCAVSGVSIVTTVHHIRTLEGLGIVERCQDPYNRRRSEIKLSCGGTRAFERAILVPPPVTWRAPTTKKVSLG